MHEGSAPNGGDASHAAPGAAKSLVSANALACQTNHF